MINLETKKTRKVLTTVGDNERIFFVYKHWRLDPITNKEVCFYVGRGKHSSRYKAYKSKRYRAYSKYGRNDDWKQITNTNQWRVEIVSDFLTFTEVCKLEDRLVELYGRTDIGTGILCNQCEGGTGTKDMIIVRKTLQGHIDDNVAFIPFTGCWIWLGTKIDGRTKINIDNKTVDARRYIYEYFTGVKITPHKQSVKSTCGYEDCVNPNHLSVVKGTNNNFDHIERKITEEDIEDAKRLLPYFYPSQIADLFPNISVNTLRALATKLQVDKVKVEQNWEKELSNHSTKHLTGEDIIDIRRLAKAGVGHQTLAELYNLNRTKITQISLGLRGQRLINAI